MSVVPRSPGSVGQVLDAGFKLFRASFVQLLVMAVIGAVLLVVPSLYIQLVPEAAAQAFSGTGGGNFLLVFGTLYVLSMLIYMLMFMAMIHRCDRIAHGQPAPLGGSVMTALRKLPATIAAIILFFIAVAIGTVLLVVPGLILMLSLFFYAFFIMLEDEGPIRSLRSSHRLVWGNWWRTAAIVTVVFVIYMVLILAVGIPFAFVDGFLFDQATAVGGGPFSLAGQALANMIGLPYMIATLLVVFYDLRLRSEGTDLASRVEELAAKG